MSAQMNLFKKATSTTTETVPQERYFAILELYEEKAFTLEELLEELEPHIGKIDIETQEAIECKAYLLPGSNFFIMDVSWVYAHET